MVAKKRKAELNAPILEKIKELEKDLKKYKEEISILGTSQSIERYGYETQMKKKFAQWKKSFVQ